jgi:hypothetical protein
MAVANLGGLFKTDILQTAVVYGYTHYIRLLGTNKKGMIVQKKLTSRL